nr:hypothetical protein [Cowpea chlorotic mottle virus]
MASSLDLLKLISERGADSRGASDIVEQQAVKQLLEQVDYSKRSKKINIRNKLTPDEENAFRARYGGAFDLNLTQQYNAPHSLAGALRIAEHYDCLSSFPPLDPIIDFGGSWWHHYSRKDTRIHSCCPVLGVRDAARHEERLCRMRKLLQECDDREDLPDFCIDRAESCSVQADWAICIHGGYDMGFTGLCEAMHSHGVRILRGTIMFDGAMLFDNEGVLPLLKCRWMKSGKGKSEVIKFDFMNESTLSYIHSWANLGSFLTESVHVIGGTTYLLERELLKCNIMTYKIVATNLKCPKETLRHCVWFENISQYVAVNIPEDWNLTHWKPVRVAKTTVREVEEIAFRCFKENKEWTENMKAIASILSAKSSTVIINGQAIMAGERLNIDEYHLVAFALTMNLYQKYENIRNFYSEMEWKGWVNHFKTRFWWGGSTATSSTGKIREFLAGKFPWLRLDSYKDSFVFLSKISDVKEFENDSVPISRLRSFFSSEDLMERIELELESAQKRRREKKKKEVEKIDEEEFQDAIDIPNDAVRDDVKPEKEPKPEVTVGAEPTGPEEASRHFAIKEFSDYCRRLDANAVSNLRRLWAIAGCDGRTARNKSILETYHRVDDMINLHYPGGQWLYPKKYDYEVGYNDSGLGPKFDDELYVVDKSCICANYQVLSKNTDNLKAPSCKISLCDGVAGCGKTTAIKSAFNIAEDLVVTANKKSAEDVREALFPENPSSEIALKVIRTADSALMHGLPQCKRLLVDEAGLLHYGQLLAVAALCKCQSVLAFGDTEQISFKSRDATFRLKYGDLQFDSRDIVTETWRCPQDVISAVQTLKKKAGNRTSKYLGWKSHSKVSRSISHKEIASPLQVTLSREKFYLTMTQADKAALVSRAKDFPELDKAWIEKHIKTVHEAQGVSVDHAVLVRLKSTKCDLFKTEEYCLVALTRHKITFEYLYVGMLSGDLIFRSIS